MPAPSDLVHEQTASTGTGNLTLVNVNGRRSFNTAFGTGGTDLFDYFIGNRDAAEWERGTGHLSAAATLVRDTVLASSNGGSAVNFSAGTKDVVNDIPAAKQARLDGAQTFTAAQAVAALLDIQQDIRWSGDISPSQITADQNDYNPTGLAAASVLRLSSDAARAITGLAGGTDGRVMGIVNVGSNELRLAAENAGSSAANRFALTGDLVLKAKEGALLIYDATSSRWRVLASDVQKRDTLTGNRTYYVRKDLGTCTVTIASPGVATKTAHGLAIDDRVVFAILPKARSCTISEANPGVVTLTAHGFSADQPIVFERTGRLPKNTTAGTTYYVIATGLTTDAFQFSASVGGAAVDTTAPTFTVTIASPGVFTLTSHGLAVGDVVYFATTGALPTGLTAGTRYFVKTVPTADTFTVSAQPEDAAINTSGTQSGTHTLVQGGSHRCHMTGALPTGLTAGTAYWVQSVPTADTFTVAATQGGAAINTSGSQSGIFNLATGKDTNSGLANTAAGALLTIQAAINVMALLDINAKIVTVQLADSRYAEAVTLKNVVGFAVAGDLVVQGNATYPENVTVAANNCFTATALSVIWDIKNMRLEAGTGWGIQAYNKATIRYSGINFTGTTPTGHVVSYSGSDVNAIGACSVSGGSPVYHTYCAQSARHSGAFYAVTLYNQPTFWAFARGNNQGYTVWASATFNGACKGRRCAAYSHGQVDTAGGGAQFLPGDTAEDINTATYGLRI